MNTQGTEKVNQEGAVERKVETVDYRSQAGQEEPTKEKVGVVHLNKEKGGDSGGGGVLSGATNSVKTAVKTAKEAIMGKGNKEDDVPK